jgi:hypothetical protein
MTDERESNPFDDGTIPPDLPEEYVDEEMQREAEAQRERTTNFLKLDANESATGVFTGWEKVKNPFKKKDADPEFAYVYTLERCFVRKLDGSKTNPKTLTWTNARADILGEFARIRTGSWVTVKKTGTGSATAFNVVAHPNPAK